MFLLFSYNLLGSEIDLRKSQFLGSDLLSDVMGNGDLLPFFSASVLIIEHQVSIVM